MKATLGIDLGASYQRAGIVDEKGHVLQFKKERTTTPENFLKFLSSILQQKKAHKNGDVFGIGIGAPGQLDLEKGEIIKSPNLPSFNDFKIAEKVKKEFNLPVFLERDTNVALIGEVAKGAGVGVKNAVMLTLGTGVGGAIIISGKLYHGEHGVGAEIGHMVIDRNGPVCTCGQRGHLEAYLGLAGVRRDYGLDHWTLIEKVEKGEKNAIEIAKKLGEILGVGMTTIVNIFDPEIIILGGGLAELEEKLLNPAVKIVQSLSFAKPVKTKIEVSKFGDYSGVLGAAKLAFGQITELVD